MQLAAGLLAPLALIGTRPKTAEAGAPVQQRTEVTNHQTMLYCMLIATDHAAYIRYRKFHKLLCVLHCIFIGLPTTTADVGAQ